MLKICITGGPCGGKSTIMSILTETLSARGYKTLVIPETATELIINGIFPCKDISMEQFQEIVLEKQLQKEMLYKKAMAHYNTDKIVVLCDRGILDQLAYIDRDKLEKLLKRYSLTMSDAFGLYDCVFHMVTAAKGAVEHYQWNDPTKEGSGNNSARRESPEEAIEKDDLTLSGWIGHPHLRVFDNSTDFNEKVQKVVTELFSALGEPIPTEIERKFLIKKPSEASIRELGCVSASNIIQTYLKPKNKATERRIRQRGTAEDGFNFYYTEKEDVAHGTRNEREKKLTPTEYISYLSEADTSLHQISKVRYCFIYNNRYFELDIYPFDNEYAILEIELNNINEEVEMPPLEIIREVTDDKSFRNHSIAKTLSFA